MYMFSEKRHSRSQYRSSNGAIKKWLIVIVGGLLTMFASYSLMSKEKTRLVATWLWDTQQLQIYMNDVMHFIKGRRN